MKRYIKTTVTTLATMNSDEKWGLALDTDNLEHLYALSNDKNHSVRRAVADNPNCPIDLLRKLSEDSNDIVRIGVAYNKNTPSDIIDKLAADSCVAVAMRALDNPNLKFETVERLLYYNNPHYYIIKSTMKKYVENPDLPMEEILRLSKHKNREIRRALIQNPNLPIEVLKEFAWQGSDASIQYDARQKLIARET